MRVLGWIIGVVLALWLLGCTTEPGDTRTFSDGITEVTVHYSQVIAPVDVYRAMEQCSGLSGDPSKVKFYALDQDILFPDGTTWYGAYDTGRRAVYYSHEGVLGHEILHDLVWTNLHRSDHPRPPFGVCVPISAGVQ